MGSEVESYAARRAIAGRRPRFVYFGGGTPSYISVKQLRTFVEGLRRAIPWDGVEEVTFECEPGTLTEAKVDAIRGIGVTRLSLGIENFDDEILQLNGRAHVSKEIERCLPWIERAGFAQLNVDLIAGMLGERWESWRRTVARTVALAPDSVTVYQMELPFNTRFTKALQNGRLAQPVADWTTKRAWHDYAINELAAAGYEVSSAYTMVRDRSRCRFVYRDSVWRGADLLGAGVASFSHLSGVHFQNVDGWGEYLARAAAGESPAARAFELGDEDRLTRELILQLKTGELDIAALRRKFGVDPLGRFASQWRSLEERQLAAIDGETVRLTRAGLLRVDMLLPDFYDPRYRDARYT